MTRLRSTVAGIGARNPAHRWLPRAALGATLAALALQSAVQAQLILITTFDDDQVLAFDMLSGSPLGTVVASGAGGLNGPVHLDLGPDGALFMGSQWTADVRRLDGETGLPPAPFASAANLYASAFTFGADGRLYVCSHNTDEILRFDGTTGMFVDTFVPAGGGGLAVPEGIAFGPDGQLYVASRGTSRIKRYHGQTGAFIDDFVAAGSGGITDPANIVFGPDGHLYVAGIYTNAVHRYHGQTGAFLDLFVAPGTGGLSWPTDLAFAPDGSLCVVGLNSGSLVRCDGTTGAFLNVIATGLPGPSGVAILPSARWQTNQPGASLVVNGRAGSVFAPPPPGSCAGVLALASTNVGLSWEMAVTSPAPPVSAWSGGVSLAGGQIVNLDLLAPGLAFLNGGTWTTPFPGPFTVPYGLPPSSPPLAAQTAVFDPSQAAGVSLSSVARVDPTAPSGLLPGPIGDDSFLEFGVGIVTCGAFPAMSFCGTSYTSFFVSSNGFVSFGAGSADPTATVAEFASGNPRLAGAWTDLHPDWGGLISVTQASGVVSVVYQSVPVTPFTMTCGPFSPYCIPTYADMTVRLDFDLAAGSCAIRNYFPVNSNSFFPPTLMGLSPGGGATDPLPQNFAGLAGTGTHANAPTDMVYHFNPSGEVPGGFTSIDFPNSSPTLWIVN